MTRKQVAEKVALRLQGIEPQDNKVHKVRTLSTRFEFMVQNQPSFHKSGSVRGMKKLYYGRTALLVRCGDYIYNVTDQPNIYYNYAHD